MRNKIFLFPRNYLSHSLLAALTVVNVLKKLRETIPGWHHHGFAHSCRHNGIKCKVPRKAAELSSLDNLQAALGMSLCQHAVHHVSSALASFITYRSLSKFE